MKYIIGVDDDLSNSYNGLFKRTAAKNVPDASLVILRPGYIAGVHRLVSRFHTAANFILDNLSSDDDVVLADTYDLVFFSDPFAWITQNIGSSTVVVGSEGLKYNQERWGVNNMQRSFGAAAYSAMTDKNISCAGFIAGKAWGVVDLSNAIYDLCRSTNAVGPIDGGGAADQAAMNLIISAPEITGDVGRCLNEVLSTYEIRARVASIDEPLVCHCGTVLADYVRDAYRPLMSDPPVISKDGRVVTVKDNKSFAVVHQYNRVSRLMELWSKDGFSF